MTRDSTDLDIENSELVPLVDITGRPQPHHPNLCSSPLSHAKAWSESGSTARRYVYLFLRLSYLVVVTPFVLAARFSLLLLSGTARRTRPHQASTLYTGAFSLATLLFLLTTFLVALISPSYTVFPPHYVAFRKVCEASVDHGRANPLNQRVFLAVSLYDPDGQILHGDWSDLVVRLIDLLGPQNTHLSIYLSDSGTVGEQALNDFTRRLDSPHTFIHHDHVPLTGAPIINLPDGAPATKRVEYLARARNIALKPLDTEGHFDKILYLNDVWFDPIEAAQLIFLTNSKPDDSLSIKADTSNYKAACALDFINPVLYYDKFATRDLDGYGMGLPVYPWFTTSGRGHTRRDALEQRDALRVKACWGGMVAFDARYFQTARLESQLASGSNATTEPPAADVVRFRSVAELDHEHSECCLVHADLIAAEPAGLPAWDNGPDSADVGIFMNPYIRTAYTAWVFNHIWFGRRTEKVLLPFQGFIDWLVRLPEWNDRRAVAGGDSIVKYVWEPAAGAESYTGRRDNSSDLHEQQDERPAPSGRWVRKSVPADAGEYCAVSTLMVRRLDPLPGSKSWEKHSVPLTGDLARLNMPDKT